MAFYSESLALPNNAFVILRDLIMEKTGIYFEESKRDMLADKLSGRVLECGFSSFLDYYYMLKYDWDSKDEWKAVLDLITVKETYFWREYDHIDALLNHVIPDFHKRQTGESLKIWSSACSTGEEPLSILMAIDMAGWLKKIKVELTASDASRMAVNSAKSGVFRDRSMRNLPDEVKERYFRNKNGLWHIEPSLVSMIKWDVINLKNDEERESVKGQDVIFCRNAFIYFREDSIKKVAEGFYNQLNIPGYLFLGVTESLFRITSSFSLTELGKTFVYKKS
jgi:chemotaxis protein methyltransferase CheR